jgi:P4 family phage/plasmid primase-like protien
MVQPGFDPEGHQQASKRINELMKQPPSVERNLLIDSILNEDHTFVRALEKTKENHLEQVRVEIASKLAQRTGFLYAAREFIKVQPVFYDSNRIWWVWKQNRWSITDETEILNIITTAMQLYGDVSVKSKTLMVEALKQEGRRNRPKDFPQHWIQFKDQIFDLQSKQTFPVSSEFFCVNPIPWDIGNEETTPMMSALFDDWVGPEGAETLFEIIAYSCYTSYPIHRLFCLNGKGRNGKSSYQGIVTKFLGQENCCSVELDELTEKSNRFSSFSLYKKLCCLMGETNFNLITNANMLKKLTGGDLIKFEKKNSDPFDAYNYAKIIISTNNLPPSADQSDGYYSRWVIIDFLKQYPETMNILSTIPEYEYRNLARKITKLLPRLLEEHGFTHQGDIEQRRKRYLERSNPLLHFLEEFYVQEVEATETYTAIYTHYAHWLKTTNRRVPSQKVFSQLLSSEGFEIKNTSRKNEEGFFEKKVFIFGLRRKSNIEDFVKEVYSPSSSDGSVGSHIPISSHTIEANRESNANATNASSDVLNAVPQEMQVPESLVSNHQIVKENSAAGGGESPGVAASMSLTPSTLGISKPREILSFLRDQSGSAASFATLLAACNTGLSLEQEERWLLMNLQALAKRGDVYNSSPDVWRLLQ